MVENSRGRLSNLGLVHFASAVALKLDSNLADSHLLLCPGLRCLQASDLGLLLERRRHTTIEQASTLLDLHLMAIQVDAFLHLLRDKLFGHLNYSNLTVATSPCGGPDYLTTMRR